MTTLLVGVLLGLVAGAILMFAAMGELARRIHPYRWTCTTKGCAFTVDAGDPGLVAGMADQHQHDVHHRGGAR